MRAIERRALTRIAVGVVGALSLILVAGCGSDSPSSAGSPGPTDPGGTAVATVSSGQPPAGQQGGPSRIISLSPTATEMMFAIGAGDLLVAVDDQSTYPAQATELPHDLSGFDPNVEAIAGYEPDLVLIGDDSGGLAAQLEQLGITTWVGPAAASLDDTYAQIEQLGAATGHDDQAAELTAKMKRDIAEIVAGAPQPKQPLSVYHELDDTFFTADSTTFIGELYAMLGLRNIADRAEGDSGGFPQLNAEAIVSANPDLIFLADTKCCGQSAQTVAARPGWDAITAVENGNVFEMDDDIASRWGPRVVDYLAAVAAAMKKATAAS